MKVAIFRGHATVRRPEVNSLSESGRGAPELADSARVARHPPQIKTALSLCGAYFVSGFATLFA